MPEHNLLIVGSNEYQKVQKFVVWLEEQGYELARYEEGDVNGPTTGIRLLKVLNEYFEVDEKELENERRRLLDTQRRLNEEEEEEVEPTFAKTHCSQCGGEFGPGNSGYSHCKDHEEEEDGKADPT